MRVTGVSGTGGVVDGEAYLTAGYARKVSARVGTVARLRNSGVGPHAETVAH